MSTKPNFIVSACRSAWVPGARQLLVVDPYIVHVLAREGQIERYEEVQCISTKQTSEDDFIRDHEYVDQKFRHYMELLVNRLDAVHGTSYGAFFWRKSLSLALLRHVSFCYQLFKICESHFNPKNFCFQILSEDSYCVPNDFNEHRWIFQNTDIGQEQLFSVYCRLFHPEGLNCWTGCIVPPAAVTTEAPVQQNRSRFKVKEFFSRKVKGVARRVLRLRSPRMAIINSYFSHENFDGLLFKSYGVIQNVRLPPSPCSASDINWGMRDCIVQNENDFDRFDKFVFSALRHGMPKAFVENFNEINTAFNVYFDHYPKLRWVVCEAWIGDMFSAMALAVLHQRGVKHIFNEHNYLAHPFLGNNLKYLYPLADEFVTLGWQDRSIPNLIRGSSLFKWVERSVNRKEHDLLFITSIPVVRAPEVNACYGESGAGNVLEYLKMNRIFLGALNNSTLNGMVFRPYPAMATRNFLAWDQGYELREYMAQMKIVDDSSSPGYSRCLMQKSRLVIANYLSTSYLEALLADVPTVVLWNKDAYLLEDKHQGFFNGLVDARIFHTDPQEAACFVEKIKHDPETWWTSPEVRHARSEFLGANFGPSDVLVEHLVGRVMRCDATSAIGSVK